MLKVSIITVCLNKKEYLKSAIESVLDQTYSNIEYIIIDGQSTDGTVELIQSYGSRISKFVSEHDDGIYYALNKGISMVTGDVIGFLHADDLYMSNNIIETIAREFNETKVDALYGDMYYVSKNDISRIIRYWKGQPFERSLLKKGWMPSHPTFFVKTDMYKKYGMFNTMFRISADYDLMIRFLSKNIKVSYIPEIFVMMRMGGVSNGSMKNIALKMQEDWIIIKRSSIGNWRTLINKSTSKLFQFFIR